MECIVRGYITGSGWESYKKDGTICGIRLPEGLEECEKLPEAIFTPSTKAPVGEHDMNIPWKKERNGSKGLSREREGIHGKAS